MSDDGGDRLLIFAPVPLFRADGQLYLEGQACNGLRLWAENFARVDVMMPLEHGPPPAAWVPLTEVGPNLARIEVHPLPTAWRADRFLRAYRGTRARIGDLIRQADYLSFAIGGLIGDWGSVACLEAHRQGRRYAVWTDRVESRVVRAGTGQGSWRHRVRSRLAHRPMAALERRVIGHAALGLFHGRDTYDAYAPYCREPVLVHDIHISKADHISADALRAKLDGCGEGPLRIVYVGRADAMKGPMDWLDVLAAMSAQGVEFRATWLGDGDLLDDMRRRVARDGLGERVSLPGFAEDRGAVLAALRDAHVFLFCHKTPESPRCLIEALTSATPILGYDSAFAADLIAQNGGGRLSPPDDIGALTQTVTDLAGDRATLRNLIARAGQDGAQFDDETVFRHRSEVIKAHL